VATARFSFSNYPVGIGIPAGWEQPWGSRNWRIEEELTAIGGRVLRHYNDGGAGFGSIRPGTSIGGQASTGQEVLVKFRVDNATTNDSHFGIVLQQDGTDNNKFGLALEVSSKTIQRRARYAFNNFANMGESAFVYTAGEDIWMRSRFEATTRVWTGKVWKGVLADEPVGWQFSHTLDNFWTFAGQAAVGNASGSMSAISIDYVSFGYDGDAAPNPAPVDPPSEITTFISPTEDEIVSGNKLVQNSGSFNAEFYRWQELVGGVWQELAVTLEPEYLWNTSTISWRRGAQLRVRGENELGESNWSLSPEFIVWQGQVEDTGFIIANRTAYAVMLAVSDVAGLKIIQGQLDNTNGDFTVPLVTLASEANRSPEILWLPVPLPDTKYKVRIRTQDLNNNWSDWMPPRVFRSINIPGPLDSGSIYYTENFLGSQKSLLGENPQVLHTYLDPQIARSPRVEFGIDLQGYYGVNYKTRGVRLRSRSNVKRDIFTRISATGYYNEGTIIMAFIPTAAVPMELMGVGDLYMSTQGTLVNINTSARPTVDYLTMEEHLVGYLRIGKLNVLGVSWKQPPPPSYGMVEGCECPVITSDGFIVECTLNTIYNRRINIKRPTDYRSTLVCPNVYKNCPKRWEDINVRYLDFGRGSPWSFQWAAEIGGSGQTMHGIIVEALAYKQALSTAAMGEISNIILAGGEETDLAILNSSGSGSLSAWLRFNEYPAPDKPIVDARPVGDIV
jgi:hypothetical protein